MVTLNKTPNPNAVKFTLGRVYFDKSENYLSADASAASPLATELFQVAGVVGVFCLNDFVSINKSADVAWDDIIPAAQRVLEAFVASNTTNG